MILILDKQITLIFKESFSNGDRIYVEKRVMEAADLINKNRGLLIEDEIKAICQISTIIITQAHNVYLGQTNSHEMTLSLDYLWHCSSAWLGSLVGHEGQHALNSGKFKGEDRWKDEQVAGKIQLEIGKKIGFGGIEVKYLEDWILESNKPALAEHMRWGFKD
jgi:hypothetical protein